ncbi:hypothetical protein PF005_g28720 [Phytophthora fragariae]|uniref:Uncharacterized protein n=1 Tax=Phytophthora fragariae TaxID=53985 RepID=A0A6A3VKZ9_9STRA|nr:hypothetical protein PF007_g28464 [Phytophthora fragariae]KAE9167566.1 hypothetical protein PF005_g28720 [Phytophthora fragariae]
MVSIKRVDHAPGCNARVFWVIGITIRRLNGTVTLAQPYGQNCSKTVSRNEGFCLHILVPPCPYHL